MQRQRIKGLAFPGRLERLVQQRYEGCGMLKMFDDLTSEIRGERRCRREQGGHAPLTAQQQVHSLSRFCEAFRGSCERIPGYGDETERGEPARMQLLPQTRVMTDDMTP